MKQRTAAFLQHGDDADKESIMVRDILLALVFLAMIIAPALVAMRGVGGEHDNL